MSLLDEDLTKLTPEEQKIYPQEDLVFDLQTARKFKTTALPQKYSQDQIERLSQSDLNLFRTYFQLPETLSREELISRVVRILRFMDGLDLSYFLDIFTYEWKTYPPNTQESKVFYNCQMLRSTDDSQIGEKFDVISGQIELFMWKGQENRDGFVYI